jgi:hypothetical protein
MKFKYVSKFKVTGSGHFPIDMLRYDRAIPATEIDANRIHNQIAEIGNLGGEVSINVIRYTEGKSTNSFGDMPTIRRWESFGWRVSDISFEKL